MLTEKQIISVLKREKADFKIESDGSIKVDGGLLLYWDEQDPSNKGWAWRTKSDSDSLDSTKELAALIKEAKRRVGSFDPSEDSLLDQLEMVLARCENTVTMLVQAGDDDDAVTFQAEVVDPLQEEILDIEADGVDLPPEVEVNAPSDVEIQAKKRIRFKRKPGIKGKKYLCCSKPKRSRTRHGDPIWVTSCSWRAGMKKGNKPVIVGRAVQGKLGRPPKVLFSTKKGGVSTTMAPGGRKIPWCR